MNIFRHIINIIFPAICKQCGKSVDAGAVTAFFCRNCWEGIRWFDTACCPRCGIPYHSIEPLPLCHESADLHLCGACQKDPPWFDTAMSAGPYEGALAEAIRLFKYKKKIHLGVTLADCLIRSPSFERLSSQRDSVDEPILCLDQLPYLIPVPLHSRRFREREFNQSVIIASRISRKTGLTLLTDVLIRHSHTRPQVELDMKDRSNNIRGVFAVQNREKIMDRDLILIDDVLTTGATVNECSRVLKESGARKVDVATVARMLIS